MSSNLNHDPRACDFSGPGLSDLEWLAFQYLTDELEAAERGTFEQRLAEDLGACEALAAMVELLNVSTRATSVPATFFNCVTGPTSCVPVCEPVGVDSALADESPVRFSAGRRRVRFGGWVLAGAIALVMLGVGHWVRSFWSTSNQIAEAWVAQFEDSELSSMDWELVELFEDQAGDEGEDDWFFSALVSLEDWPVEEQGGGT